MAVEVEVDGDADWEEEAAAVASAVFWTRRASSHWVGNDMRRSHTAFVIAPSCRYAAKSWHEGRYVMLIVFKYIISSQRDEEESVSGGEGGVFHRQRR